MKTLLEMGDYQKTDSVAYRLRKKRTELFTSMLDELPRPIRIIDVGGTVNYWNALGLAEQDGLEVTLVNRFEATDVPDGYEWVVGDARDLSQFDDQSFDIAFSNSVIEHVGAWSDQQQMANEMRRVGRRYFVQTPNRWFPIEPHFHFPYFQFLPETVKVRLLMRFSLGWFDRVHDLDEARAIAREIRLLTGREFARLFPEAEIVPEKYYGLTKSFMAIKN